MQRKTASTRRGELGRAAFVALTASLLAGCSTTHDQLVAFVRQHEAEVATGTYRVRPPDALAVHAPNAPEVDGTQQMVRSDGKIVFRLLGEVDVAGLTTGEISQKIEAQLSRYYVEPEVMVEVVGYNSQFYYVFGEVNSPGPVRYTGRDTVLMALAQARPNFFAWRGQIRVTRPGPTPEAPPKTIIVDLDKMLNEGDMTANILLQEGDIVEVPPTPLAWCGHRVRELLYPVQPVAQLYSQPADIIRDTGTYQNGWDGGSDDDSDSWRRRFGR